MSVSPKSLENVRRLLAVAGLPCEDVGALAASLEPEWLELLDDPELFETASTAMRLGYECEVGGRPMTLAALTDWAEARCRGILQ